MMEKLAVAQCKMLGITLRDRKRNTWIRQETGVSDIINAIRNAKHRWAGHIARGAQEIGPETGSSKTRWRDDLTRQFGLVWSRLAKHRHL
ncbi:unnamed protein product, partial [Porites lobata]